MFSKKTTDSLTFSSGRAEPWWIRLRLGSGLVHMSHCSEIGSKADGQWAHCESLRIRNLFLLKNEVSSCVLKGCQGGWAQNAKAFSKGITLHKESSFPAYSSPSSRSSELQTNLTRLCPLCPENMCKIAWSEIHHFWNFFHNITSRILLSFDSSVMIRPKKAGHVFHVPDMSQKKSG